jgi:DNA-binding protein HU-beta
MKKSELVARIAVDAKIPRTAAERTVNVFISVVAESLRAGDKIRLPALGTFFVSTRAARRGRNLHTGEEISIPATRVPRFKAGKTLKDALRG